MSVPPASHPPVAEQAGGGPRRGGRRWPWIVFGVLLALAAGSAACEWAGWPFVKGPAERWLSQRLQRDVAFGDRFELRLLGRIRLSSDAFVVGPPTGAAVLAGAPGRFVEADDLTLVVPYRTVLGILRTGGPDAQAAAHVSALEIGRLDAHLWRDESGRANWQFGGAPDASQAPPASVPQFDRLVVRDGRLRIDDAPSKLKLDAEVRTEEGQAAPQGAGLQVSGKGTYDGRAVSFRATSSGAMPIATSGAGSPPLPLTLAGSMDEARFEFDGRAADIVHLRSLDGDYTLSGPSLAAVGDAVGVTLPNTAPFTLHGRLRKADEVWSTDVASLSVGASRLSGEFTYDPRPEVPLLNGSLRGERLVLADLAPAIGAPARPQRAAGAADAAAGTGATGARRNGTERGHRILPQREFDIPSLRAMNASVKVELRELDLSTELLEPFRPLEGMLTLYNGVLKLDELQAGAAGGRVGGTLSLDSQSEAPVFSTDLKWSGVDLDRWLTVRNRNVKPKAGDGGQVRSTAGYLSGSLGGQAQLRGAGRSTAAILASLDGSASAWIRNGSLSHLVVEAMGLDIAQGLGLLIVGDEPLPLNCAAARFVARHGELHNEVGVFDTRDSTIFSSGSLSLADERLALTLVARPKDFSPLTLRAPLRVAGTFADPEVRLDAKTIGLKVLASAALAAVNPLAALIPLMDLGDAEQRNCREALAERPFRGQRR